MSLTEQDREILLQEIQQIQRTLEATGRNFGSEENGFRTCSSDEAEQEDDGCDEQDLYYPTHLKQEDDYEDGDKDAESPVQTPSIYNDYYNANIRGYSGENENNLCIEGDLVTEDTEVNFEYPENAMAPNIDHTYSPMVNASIDRLSTVSETIPKSSISAKLKKRIKQESEFGSKSYSQTSKSKRKHKNASSNVSVDTSSFKSLPTKQMEKINMANLYVERLFGGFRNKKSKPSHLVAVGEEKYGSKDLKSSANLSTLENLLQVNRRYKELLADELKKVELAIARNRRAQDEVVTTMQDKEVKNATFASLSKACIGRYGNPYFKDNEGVGPPDNKDTIERKKKVKVNPFNRGSKSWKNTEATALEEGVYHNNLEKRLEPFMTKLKKFDKEYKEKLKNGEKMEKGCRHQLTKEIARIKELPRNEILIDPSQIDFFRISKNFLPTRDEFECRVQWCNVAHPSINQSKFSKDEDAQLIKLAKKNNNYQWESIAKELGTNRTPIQCLQRYQRTLNRDMIKTVWDEDDDEKLKYAVGLHGNNWVLVASVLGDRTGDQCMHRWQKTLDPLIKRGKWSNEEDQCLLKAVEKHGFSNWKVVKKEVPGRTDAQCRERYVSTLDPSKDWGAFNEEEDRKIIELVRKHGLGKWATIAKEFPSRRDNQIWRRYTQIEADNYHKYRRGVIWKRRSVLNYFFHRGSERRDYSLEELDVNYSPSLTHMESRKLERTREELVKCGYTEEEITRKLARMHYEGLFSRSIYKPRQRPYSQGRCKRLKSHRKNNPGKLASEELVTEIKDVLSNVKDPEAELPPAPVEPLKRKTKVERQINMDGYHVIPKPKYKKKGRKETWLEKKVDGDTFRRKCHEVIMKFKLKTIWYDDAKTTLENYYYMVQEEGNSFFHKQVLNVYTDVSSKLQTLYNAYKEIEGKLLSQDRIPVIIMQEDIIYQAPIKRMPRRSTDVPINIRKRNKKMTTFKKMVAEASRKIRGPLHELPKQVIDISKVKMENVDEACTVPPITAQHCSYIKYPTSTQSGGYLAPQESCTESTLPTPEGSCIASPLTTPHRDNNSPTSTHQKKYYDVNSVHTKYTHSTPLASHRTPAPTGKYNVHPIPCIEPATSSKRLSIPQQFGDQSTISIPNQDDNQAPVSTPSTSLASRYQSKHLNVEQVKETHAVSNNKHILTTKNRIMATSSTAGNLTTPIGTPPSNKENSTMQGSTSNIQQPPQNSPKESTNIIHQQAQLFLTDQLKTFTLLLQALHVDTTGVMNSLSRNSSTNNPLNTGILSSNTFPTCYPLSPNSASLLGFRKLLLHRRILGEIVKQHSLNSERLGIPVARDMSYQNSKSYDALRKRFRSIFTWPAFLATFIPKYIETSPHNVERSDTTIPSTLNVEKTNTQNKCRRLCLPQTIMTSPTTNCTTTPATRATTSTSRGVSETPLKTLATVSEYVRRNSENDDSGGPTKTLDVEINVQKQCFVDNYLQKRKLETINKMSQQNSKEVRKRKSEDSVLNPSIASPCKKPRTATQRNHKAAIVIPDLTTEDDCKQTKHVSKRLSQNEEYHQKPLKKRKGRKKKDDRTTNSQTIFIPPAVAVKIEKVEEDLSIEIVENSEPL